MLTIELRGEQQLVTRITNANDKVKAEVTKTVTRLILELEAKIKGEKLSGQVLKVRSGDLRASVHALIPVEQTASGARGTVRQSGDVKYGAIHEFGGRTSAHDIVATKGKALAFLWNGKQAFYKSVHHPGSVIPERSYMRSSLAEMRPEAIEQLTAAVRRGLS